MSRPLLLFVDWIEDMFWNWLLPRGARLSCRWLDPCIVSLVVSFHRIFGDVLKR